MAGTGSRCRTVVLPELDLGRVPGGRAFPDPLLLRVEREDRVVGLALFNRRRGRLGRELLWLNQSGDSALDTVFVEHNGILLARDATDQLTDCLQAMLSESCRRRTRPVAPGACGFDWAASVRTTFWRRNRPVACCWCARAALRMSIWPRCRPGPMGISATLSSNTRYQFAAPIAASRSSARFACSRQTPVQEAQEALDGLVRLHQASWAARGQPGAFDNPAFLHFHRSLVARGVPRGEVELLRIMRRVAGSGLSLQFPAQRPGTDVSVRLRLSAGTATGRLTRETGPDLSSCGHTACPRNRRDGLRLPCRSGPVQTKPRRAAAPALLAGPCFAAIGRGTGDRVAQSGPDAAPDSFARAEAPR